MVYSYQIDTTEPNAWKEFKTSSRDRKQVAAEIACKYGPGQRTVYLAIGEDRHATGSPIAVVAMSVLVGERGKPDTPRT